MSLSIEKNFPESLKNRRLTEVITGINNLASAVVLNECDDDDDDTTRDISEIDEAYWSSSRTPTLSCTKFGFRNDDIYKLSGWPVCSLIISYKLHWLAKFFNLKTTLRQHKLFPRTKFPQKFQSSTMKKPK